MQVSVENVGTLERKLTVRFPAERLESQVSERIREMGRTVRLKGFRPGKVPASVVKQRFGAQVRGEALSELIGSTLREAFEQEKLQPVAQPAIDTTGEAEDGDIAYTATFEIMPDLPQVDVAALKIERPVAEVSDADIDGMIETLRAQRRTFDEVERASRVDDLVTFEYSAEAEGYRFPQEGLERASGVIGSESLFPALNEALTGHEAGESFEQDLVFPDEFGNDRLAGKTARVAMTIIKVQEPDLPELDSEFVRSFGVESGTMEDFRTEIRNNLEREMQAALTARLKSTVAEALAEAHPDIDVPRTMIRNESEGVLRNSIGKDQEVSQDMLKAVEPMARKRVIAALLMGDIARREEIKVDRKRIGEALGAIASTYEEPEQVIEMYNNDPQLMQGLSNRVMEDQVVEWVAEHADTTDNTLSFNELMRPEGA